MRLALRLAVALSYFLAACQTSPQLETSKKCMTLAVLPPENIDEAASDYIAGKWIKEIKLRSGLKSCDRILHPHQLRDIYLTINISHQQKSSAKGLTQAQRTVLREQGKANFVAVLRYKFDRGTLIVKADVDRLSEEASSVQKTLETTVRVRDADSSYFVLDYQKNFGLYLTKLIPTTISIGYYNENLINSYTYSKPGRERRYYELGREKRSSLPPFISAIRLESIPFRSGYDPFDVDLSFMPYVSFTAFDNLYTYATKEEYDSQSESRRPIQAFRYGLAFYAITPNILGEITFYTPLGALFFGVGGGPSFSYLSDTEGNEQYRVGGSYLGRMGYRIFMTERWFLKYMVEIQSFQGRIANEYFRSELGFIALVNVGYIFPELQKGFRDTIL